MSSHEIDLKLQYRYANQYPKAIRLVEAGLIDLKPLVTHRFTLETAIEAFKTAIDVASGGKQPVRRPATTKSPTYGLIWGFWPLLAPSSPPLTPPFAAIKCQILDEAL